MATFGYTSAGATRKTSSSIFGSTFTVNRMGNFHTGAAGTLSSLHAYLGTSQSAGNTAAAYVAINEKDSGGPDSHGQIALVEKNCSLTLDGSWFDFAAGNEELNSVDYALSSAVDPSGFSGSFFIGAGTHYDSGGAGTWVTKDYGASYADSKEDPFTVAAGVNSEIHSIYATYEVAASDDPITKVKVSGTFVPVAPKVKLSGTFVEKTSKVKVGGTFV